MKLTSKIAASIAAGALAFGMLGVVGCSSEDSSANTELTTAEINAQDIEVTGVGFTVLDDETVNYAFTINNPNDGYIAEGVTFTIEGYDADGNMLIGGGDTIQTVYPGVETASAGTAYMSPSSSPLTTFDVKPLMEHINWTKTTQTAEEIQNEFTTSDVQVQNVDGTDTITGNITIDFGDDASTDDAASMLDMRATARVVVLFKNDAGEIIGGGSSTSIMLDASMIPIYGAGTTVELDENGVPIEQEEGAELGELVGGDVSNPEGGDGNQVANVATTTWTITIPGNIPFASYDVIVTPGN